MYITFKIKITALAEDASKMYYLLLWLFFF